MRYISLQIVMDCYHVFVYLSLNNTHSGNMVKFANQMSPYASPKARVLADCMFRPPKRMFVSCCFKIIWDFLWWCPSWGYVRDYPHTSTQIYVYVGNIYICYYMYVRFFKLYIYACAYQPPKKCRTVRLNPKWLWFTLLMKQQRHSWNMWHKLIV